MATFQFEGVDAYISQLSKIYGDTDEIIGRSIYEGAGVVMRSVVNGIDNIVVDNNYGTEDNKTAGPTTYQKEGLKRSVGITKMRTDGSFKNVKIGFDGYNKLKTKRWPNGQPNAMIARSVESGTSWMNKQPFMRKAENASRGACEQAMAKQIDIEIEKRVKEAK